MSIDPCARIHPTALVDAQACIAADVEVGPFAVIGADVVLEAHVVIGAHAVLEGPCRIAAGCVIGAHSLVGAGVELGAASELKSHVVLKGPSRIGRGNRIYQFASVGEACQDKKYAGEPTVLEIGDNNVIREGCTIHRGTVQDEGITRIGSNNLLMAYVHVGHDCVIGNNCILANNAAIAGHVKMADGAILGGYTTVHQFTQIGAFSMSAANSAVFKDIPAFVMVGGNPAAAHGMNFEGMRRRGYSPELIRSLRQAYKLVYRQGLPLKDALETLKAEPQSSELDLFIHSLECSTRGITR